MAGHNKWSKVKHIKARVDAIKGRVFSKCAHEIALAARAGGGDPAANARLRTAIDNAKAVSMPKENIERAIRRGTGKVEGAEMGELRYEGYGPEGVAYMVDVLTDNKNRTLAEVKHAFNRAGGAMASAGSVGWQFEQKGYIELAGDNLDFDEVFMVAAEAGADDVVDEEGTITVYTPRELLGTVETALTAGGYEVADAQLRWEAKNETELPPEKAMSNMRLMGDLEDLDDVQSVASNLMMTDEVIAAFETA